MRQGGQSIKALVFEKWSVFTPVGFFVKKNTQKSFIFPWSVFLFVESMV